MLLNYLKQDKYSVGIVSVLCAELIPAAVLYVVLTLIGQSPAERYSWFAGTVLPGLLLVRWFAKRKECLNATKGAIAAVFVSFVAYLFFY